MPSVGVSDPVSVILFHNFKPLVLDFITQVLFETMVQLSGVFLVFNLRKQDRRLICSKYLQ